ncbi:hypothetical protein SA2016_3754 [Sinomonas atrocyanea]|uniref:Uncharacterized protein n=1 Tax=Sinomonas atrocyanea TaxID=37927 RepID=A0A127A654_9MICC|nr:hypothetical protein SA2016_3754 [Sinomonas atrocyanea]
MNIHSRRAILGTPASINPASGIGNWPDPM